MLFENLGVLCLGVLVLLLIVLAAIAALALLRNLRDTPTPILPHAGAGAPDGDTIFKLHHYFPLPEGFAYMEAEDGMATIIRIDDELTLAYRVEENRLIFEEPFVRADGTHGTRTHEVPYQSKRPPSAP